MNGYLAQFEKWFDAAAGRAVLVAIAGALLITTVLPLDGYWTTVALVWLGYGVVRVLAWGVMRWVRENPPDLA